MSAPPTFKPTRAAALVRLEEFLPVAGNYAAVRNFVRPGHNGVARISPWLQKRLVLESEVVAMVRRRWDFASVEKFVQEVYWRTYWKGWLEHRPEAWNRWVQAVPRLQQDLDSEKRSSWEAACAGRTGIAGFDDWAKELVATGYMHNHARMWFASIWIHTLRLPWELGAAFFYRYLHDGDAASNTLSWRWVAGLQTVGKTYLARADNISHYTDGRFEIGKNELASVPIKVTEEPIPTTDIWMEEAPLFQTAAAHVESERVGLWIHPEDLAVEQGELAGQKFGAIFAGWPAGIAERAGWSEGVAAWSCAALEEGATRASRHFGAAVENGRVDDLTGRMVEWAKGAGLKRVTAYRPFVGPWLDEARLIEKSLAAQGVEVIWRRREWDTKYFPSARRGYFPFWEKVDKV